jgi:hypothetical protein
MTTTIDRYIAVSSQVAAAASTGELAAENAVEFCRVVLPRLLVELEIAKRVEERLAERFPDPFVPEPAVEPKKPRRKARKKAARRRKHAS